MESSSMSLARELVEARRRYVRGQREIGELEGKLRTLKAQSASCGTICDRLYAQLFQEIAREELNDGTISCEHASGAV